MKFKIDKDMLAHLRKHKITFKMEVLLHDARKNSSK